MEMIIIGAVIMGCLFYAYIIYVNKRQGKVFRSSSQYDYDAPRIIQLPENIEREKRRRHIR